MKTKNYFLLLFVTITATTFGQDLIIKRLNNVSPFSPSFSASSYYFSFVEVQVLNNTIDLNDYKLKYKRGTDNSTTTKSIGAMFTKTVDSYTDSDPNTSTSDNTSIPVGASFYFVEMYKVGGTGNLTLSNATFYKVFAEYMGFSEAEMIDKKYFTVATVGTQDFDTTLSHSGSVLTLKDGNTNEDIWEDGLVDDTKAVRVTLSPTTTFNLSQWNYSSATLVVNDDFKSYEQVFTPNPARAGTELTFNDKNQKEIRVYDFSGALRDAKNGVTESYIVPENLGQGVYFFNIQSEDGQSVHKIIIR